MKLCKLYLFTLPRSLSAVIYYKHLLYLCKFSIIYIFHLMWANFLSSIKTGNTEWYIWNIYFQMKIHCICFVVVRWICFVIQLTYMYIYKYLVYVNKWGCTWELLCINTKYLISWYWWKITYYVCLYIILVGKLV